MPTEPLHTVGLQIVKRNWSWYLALGILLVLLGIIAIGRSCLLTVASVGFFGWLIIIGGFMEGIHAFWKERGWSGFFVDLLTGIIYIVVGFMIVVNPWGTAVALMMLIAVFLIFGCVFRIAAALVRYPNWIWMLLHGIVNLLLVILIWWQWPQSRVWGIGLLVGIEMTFNGWSLVNLGLRAKNLPTEDEALPLPSS